MGPLALLAGIVVPYEALGYCVVQDVVGGGVQHHLVHKRRSLYVPLLRFVHLEDFKLAWPVGFGQQEPRQLFRAGQGVCLILGGSGLSPFALPCRQVRLIQRFKLAHFFVGHAVNHLKSWLAGDRGRSASPCLTPARSPTAAGCVPSRTARLGVMCLSSARAQAFDRMRPPLMMVYCVRLFPGY